MYFKIFFIFIFFSFFGACMNHEKQNKRCDRNSLIYIYGLLNNERQATPSDIFIIYDLNQICKDGKQERHRPEPKL
jgi:hypothetical protein